MADDRPRLAAIAYKLSRSRDLAEDLVDGAYLALLEGRRTWNREKQPSFYDFAASVVGSLWSNNIRSGSAKFELDTYIHRPEGHAPLLARIRRQHCQTPCSRCVSRCRIEVYGPWLMGFFSWRPVMFRPPSLAPAEVPRHLG